MIKINKALNKIDKYNPSNRDIGKNFIKLDWNECNITFNKKFLKILSKSLLEINYSEYPIINNKSLLNKLGIYCNTDTENIQIFNGSDSALHYIFSTFLNKNTKILIFHPNYSHIETYIKLYSNKINYSFIVDPFGKHKYNFNDVKKNNIIYISNPNNPTGYCLKSNIIESLLKLHPNKLFIIDEAYYEFSKKSCIHLVKKYNNIIVTRTFSKAFSLASIRLGYICANSQIINQINKIRNPKEVNSFAQKLGETALDNINFINERINLVIKNRKMFQNILHKNKIKFIKSESNFVLIKINNSKSIIDDLYSKKILVRDRSTFSGLENSIRITIGNWNDMKKIIKIILDKNEY